MDENSTELNKMELAKEESGKQDEFDTNLPENYKHDDQKPTDDDKVNDSTVDDDDDDLCDDKSKISGNVNLLNDDENLPNEADKTNDKQSDDDDKVVQSTNDEEENVDVPIVDISDDTVEVPLQASKRTRESVKHTDVAPKRKRQRVTHDVELKCPECKFKCFTKTGILNHMRKHIDEKAKVIKLTCALCPAYYDTNEELVKHKESHRNESHSFICAKCKLAFTDHLDWLQHRLEHWRRAYYKCEECHRYFYEKKAFRLHLETHYDRKLRCGICNEKFPTERRLRIHTSRHARAAVPPPRKAPARRNKPAPAPNTPARASNQGTHRCGECGSSCQNAAKLEMHLLAHAGIRVIQCWHCGKGCNTEQQRRVHTRVHTDERPFACSHCPQRFKQSVDLARHWCKLAPNQKTFKCNVCQKQFKGEQSLTSHMMLHSNDRPFECKECPKKFVNIKSLRMHVIYKHTSDWPFKCDECGMTFKMSAAFNRHTSSVLGCDKYRKRTKPRTTFD